MATATARKKKVPVGIQGTVDEYLSDYKLLKELEAKMKPQRDSIEQYMKDNNLQEIVGTKGGKVSLVDQDRAPTSAVYTTYDFNGVATLLDAVVLEKCAETVINRDKLEALVKLKMAPKTVQEFKLTKSISTFRTTCK